MASVRRVLVPIDGSDNSLRALAHVAKRLRADKHAKIVLINVQQALPASVFVTQAMIREYYETQSEAALARARRRLAQGTLRADIEVRIGEPASTIVDVARRTRCSEIVMRTRGLGRLKGLVLGSVTTKVIHLARIPVTVVP